MTKTSEIAYMQARIARLASEKWNLPIREVGRIFSECQVCQHIKECYDLFHVEGDEAIWEDLLPFFRRKGYPGA